MSGMWSKKATTSLLAVPMTNRLSKSRRYSKIIPGTQREAHAPGSGAILHPVMEATLSKL